MSMHQKIRITIMRKQNYHDLMGDSVEYHNTDGQSIIRVLLEIGWVPISISTQFHYFKVTFPVA